MIGFSKVLDFGLNLYYFVRFEVSVETDMFRPFQIDLAGNGPKGEARARVDRGSPPLPRLGAYRR